MGYFFHIIRYVMVGVLLAPLLALLIMAFAPAGDDISHLVQTVLPRYVMNSVGLMVGVGCVTAMLGVGSAWLVSCYQFTGVRFFHVALYLPLAIPAYIVAFVYGGMFEFAGPVQTALRAWFDWGKGDYWFPEIRSLSGAIFVLSVVLYPYVFMLSRIALSQASEVITTGRSLGLTQRQVFVHVVLPYIRPAVMGGVVLVCMEALGDFGAVQFLAVDTFTTGIYRTWFGMHNPVAASYLSLMLFALVIVLIYGEYASRKGAKYTSRSDAALRVKKLRGWKNALAWFACMLPLFFGFILPVLGLIDRVVVSYYPEMFDDITTFLTNSVLVASVAAICTVVVGFMVSYMAVFPSRLRVSRGENILWRMGSLGYAVPGSVIAVGILIFYGWVDRQIDAVLDTGLLLSGTLFALVAAYMFRFLAISVSTIDGGMHKVTPEIDWSAQVLGGSVWQNFRKIHLPMVRSSLSVAALLVFVECVKELPATLIIRPFNFETLATRSYELASDERLNDSALPALFIIAISLVPVYLVCRKGGVGAEK